MKHTLSVLVQNEAGVLSSLSEVFSGRGYNIESLTVAPTIDNDYSRVTIVTSGDEKVIEQICKQLHRLIYTLKVAEISPENSVSRELVLLKVTAKDEDRSEILRIAEIFESKIVDVSPKTYTLQIVGDQTKVQAVIELLRPLGIKEIVRSGLVSMTKENQFMMSGK